MINRAREKGKDQKASEADKRKIQGTGLGKDPVCAGVSEETLTAEIENGVRGIRKGASGQFQSASNTRERGLGFSVDSKG